MKVSVITMDTDVTLLQDAVDCILGLGKLNNGSYVCLSNVHMCMETFDDTLFREVVNKADFVLPDGKPIAIAQRLLGAKNGEQIRGQDIMRAVCAASVPLKLKIGLYGGSDQLVLERVIANLKIETPGIDISFAYSPPFRPLTKQEDKDITEAIRNAGVHLLFVGIGCPKQEYWMAAHKRELNCVMFGVGAAFDFISGNKKHAPRWMQNIGLEWFYRLCSEPRRLWKRYLKHNPRFIYHFTRQLIFSKKF